MTSLSTEVSQLHEREEAREAALLTGKAMAEIDAALLARLGFNVAYRYVVMHKLA